jgi:hypothetical protein
MERMELGAEGVDKAFLRGGPGWGAGVWGVRRLLAGSRLPDTDHVWTSGLAIGRSLSSTARRAKTKGKNS